MSPKTRTTHPVHWLYRLVFNYIEPFLAFGGVVQLYFFPKAYLDIVNPTLSARLDLATSLSYTALQTLYTQIVGGWLIITFNDIVTLRVCERDVKVWRCVMAAHLISDIVYCWALYLDCGSKVWDYMRWSAEDWLTMLTTIPPLLMKVTFLLGMGVGTNTANGPKYPAKES